MGLFGKQLANVVEWEESRDDVIFYKWNNNEIKKDSRLIVRPGQDAIFLYNGVIEGIFEKEGNYDIESEIVPFLSTLKGFKFGFNSGIRAEVLFVNTKEFNMRWGTKQPVNIPTPSLPGGMPIRANGTFQFKVGDYGVLLEKIAGVKKQFTTEEVRERLLSVLNQLLLRWIVREGKDLFNIQANAVEIAEGIRGELDTEMQKIGLNVTSFQIDAVSYPEEVQSMVTKVAGQSMVGDMNRYSQMAMLDAMGNNTAQGGNTGNIAADMASMQMGMMMGQQMANQMAGAMANGQAAMQQAASPAQQPAGNPANAAGAPTGSASGGQGAAMPNFCPNCGQKTTGTNFCPNCGQKLV